MSSCLDCQYLGFERFGRGETAARCFAPFPPPWGNGRIVGNPTKQLIPERIERPVWCEKEDRE